MYLQRMLVLYHDGSLTRLLTSCRSFRGPQCYKVRSEDDRNRFRERERQAQRAEARGEKQIGT
jgi:hypothetical protein